MKFYAKGNWVMRRRRFWFDKRCYKLATEAAATQYVRNIALVASTKLKPCPFCGGKVYLEPGKHAAVFWVVCPKSSQCFSSGLISGFYSPQFNKAVKQWNTRFKDGEQ